MLFYYLFQIEVCSNLLPCDQALTYIAIPDVHRSRPLGRQITDSGSKNDLKKVRIIITVIFLTPGLENLTQNQTLYIDQAFKVAYFFEFSYELYNFS